MTFRMQTRNNPALVLAACSLTGALCACGSSAPTQQLIDARRAYHDAAESSAARYTPDDLLSARQALDKAEKEHDEDPGSDEEIHLAYLAARKAQIAKASGEIAQAKRAEAQSEAAYQARLERAATESRSDLAKAAKELEGKQGEVDALERLRQREIAEIQEDQRGTVITITGAVLFSTGKAALSPPARLRLDQVADALTLQPLDKPIQVIGHTDDRGSESTNDRLSTQRAQAVADQLMANGIDRQRITVEGHGENEPIASNDTADGRAMNRRVEIILRTTRPAAGMGSPSGTTLPQTEDQPSGPAPNRPSSGEPSPTGD